VQTRLQSLRTELELTTTNAAAAAAAATGGAAAGTTAIPTTTPLPTTAYTIRECEARDFHSILAVVNDGAAAYTSLVPPVAHMWAGEPYLSAKELQRDIDAGVTFSCRVNNTTQQMVAVMGTQVMHGEVTLIRHAYVRTASRREGHGSAMLRHLLQKIDMPVLLGTWAAANYAVSFYEKFGFTLIRDTLERDRLYRRYWHWSLSDAQREVSVVFADQRGMQEIVQTHVCV
jgi:N-acetylglutamate synthase-like GNAT family acetyltransferase